MIKHIQARVDAQEAVEFQGTSESAYAIWEWVNNLKPVQLRFEHIDNRPYMTIEGPLGRSMLLTGDWMIRSKANGFYVCEKSQFAELFEVVE